jgi:hypothetical protein
MMDQEMSHDDMSQDAAMIKKVLQKVIDEMDMMESDRLMPDHMKPKMVAAKVDVMSPKSEHEMSEDSDMESEEHELDPEIMKQLMDKAGSADENGSTEEDSMEGLDPEIAAAVMKKKGMK